MSQLLNKIHWLAGLLEGEASFGLLQNKYPLIQLRMVDLDTIQKARDILKPSNNINTSKITSGRLAYSVCIMGQSAIEWMMTLYPLMSGRRREKFREIIQVWKSTGTMTKGENISATKRDNKLIKLVMMSRNCTREEAIEIVGDSLTPVKQTIKEEDNGTIQ